MLEELKMLFKELLERSANGTGYRAFFLGTEQEVKIMNMHGGFLFAKSVFF
jgi:hypothetical protein